MIRAAADRSGPGASEWVSIVVLHTNDVHGGVLPRRAALAGIDATGDVGGAAALAAFVASERAAAKRAGAEVLLLDGGDVWRGTPEGDLTRGDLVVETLGRLGYDAVALGNHEMDLGVENAARLAGLARFPWLSANVVESSTQRPPPWLRPSVVLERAGLRIGVIGLSPPETPRIVIAGATAGLEFLPEVPAAVEAAAALEKSTDVLLFVTHLGPERDRAVADAVPRAALVVGGHTHQRLHKPVLGGPGGKTWIVQAGSGGVLAGRVRLRVRRSTKEVVLDDAALVPLVPGKVGSDADTSAFLAERIAKVPALAALDREVARLGGELARVGSPGASSAAGNAVADAMRVASGTDVAFTNRGGIRVTLPEGPVTARDLHLLFPFENTLVTGTITGAELRDVLATSLSGPVAAPLEVSGLTATYRTEPGAPRPRATIVSVAIGGRPLDPEARYRFGTNSYLAGGGDGHRTLSRIPTKDTGLLVRDVLRSWMEERGTVTPDRTPRVRPE